MDDADLVLHNAFEEMSVSDIHHGDKNSRQGAQDARAGEEERHPTDIGAEG